MSITPLFHALVIIVCTLISGFCDSQGFVHSARLWHEGKVVWGELGLAALNFALGISLFWLSQPSLRAVGLASPEIQSILWFAVVIIGVAVASGKFFAWQRLDQVIGVAVLVGMAWLLFRTGE